MVTHIVIFHWRAEASARQIAELAQGLDRLRTLCPSILSLHHGPDLAFRDGNGDYALVATFADKAGWDAYQADPAHKAFLRDHVTPILSSREAIQF